MSEFLFISSIKFLFGIFNSTTYQTLQGYVILPEIRQTVLAIVGFYFGTAVRGK